MKDYKSNWHVVRSLTSHTESSGRLHDRLRRTEKRGGRRLGAACVGSRTGAVSEAATHTVGFRYSHTIPCSLGSVAKTVCLYFLNDCDFIIQIIYSTALKISEIYSFSYNV